MKNKKASWLLLVLLPITIAVVSIAATLHQQENRAGVQQRAIQKRIHVEDYPIAESDLQQSDDPQERYKRKARSRRHDLADVKGADLDHFTLKDSDPEILLPLAVSHAKTEPGLPVVGSDAVVVGEVINAQAYLSNDKTNVYSEFVVRVADVLKNDCAGSLYSGAQIATERPGGRVRFPSGKILLRGAPYGKNMPRIGQRYIFFLKQNRDGQDYSIITAYELRSGHIFPLDGSPDGDVKSRQFAEYEEYVGMAEATFITLVREAIARDLRELTSTAINLATAPRSMMPSIRMLAAGLGTCF